MADDFNMSFFETSAKTNQNANEVFKFLTQEILKTNEGKTQSGGVGIIKLEQKIQKKDVANKYDICLMIIKDKLKS